MIFEAFSLSSGSPSEGNDPPKQMTLERAKGLVGNIFLMPGSTPAYASDVMDLLTRHYGFYPVNAEATPYWGTHLADVKATVGLEAFGVDSRAALKEFRTDQWQEIIKPYVPPHILWQNIPCDQFHQFVTLSKIAATARKVEEEAPGLSYVIQRRIERAMHFNMLVTLFPEKYSSAIAFPRVREERINGAAQIKQGFTDSVALSRELYLKSNLARPQDDAVEIEAGLARILIPGETFYDAEDAVLLKPPRGWRKFF